MNMLKVLGVVGGVAVALISIQANIPPLATVEIKTGPSMLGKLPDGGPIYLAQFGLADGGSTWLRMANRDCVRRSLGGSSLLCRRGTTLDNRDFGELNRFPASEAQPLVNDCESCVCGVWEGEDANQSEASLLSSAIGILLP